MKLDPQSERRLRRWLEEMVRRVQSGRAVEGGFYPGADGRLTRFWVRTDREFIPDETEKGLTSTTGGV